MRSVWACALACALAPRAWAAAAEAEAYKARGDERARARDTAGAVDMYQQAVVADPDYLEAQDLLATQRIALGALGDVIAQLEPVIRRHPDHARGLYALAYCYRKTGRSAQAVTAYVAYLKLRPDDPDPYYGYAEALLAIGDRAAALQALRVYVGMEKRSEESVWVERARARIRELEGADPALAAPTAAQSSATDVERFRTLVRDHPDDATAWAGLANALRAHGQKRSADAAARRVERLKGGTLPPARVAPARATPVAAPPQPPELVDALIPLPDPAAARRARAEEERAARAEKKRRDEDDRKLRAEQRRLARQEARRKQAEEAARLKAEREQAKRQREEEASRREAEREEMRRKEEDEAAQLRADRERPTAPVAAAPTDAIAAARPGPQAVRPVRPPPDVSTVSAVDIERLRTAVRDDSGDADSWFLLAAALRDGGRDSEAMAAERRYAKLRPGFPVAPSAAAGPVPPSRAGTGTGTKAQADALEQTLRQQAREFMAAGDRLFDAGRFDEALAAYHDAAEADPDSAEAEYKGGLCAERLGRNGDAAAAYQRALSRDGGHAKARAALDRLRPP
jgi:tetratricopeptide (TPR) repeat protein